MPNVKKTSPAQSPTTTDNNLAFQHNHLIRTPLRMGLVEARIFVHALGQIHQKDKAFKAIQIPLSAIVGDNPSGEAYEGVHDSCRALVRQILNVLPPNSKRGNLSEVPLMAGIKLDLGTGTITGQFNELARPYLLQLKETGNFTSANIQNLLTFTNPNSARLYWILLSYRNMESKAATVKKQLDLFELKGWMLKDTAKYPLFAEFKRNVLDPVAEDFKRIGFGATWAPIRTGKKTTALAFSIPKDKPEPKKLAAKTAAATGETSDWTTWLAAVDKKLQTAYTSLLDKHQLTPATTKKVVQWIAANPDKAAAFYKAKHNALTSKEPVKDMKKYTLARLNEALGTAFK